MEYPWMDNFIIYADSPADPETGTNEPVDILENTDEPKEPQDTGNPEDKPDPDLANEIAGDSSDVQSQIDALKGQVEELSKNIDLQSQIDILKRKIENINVLDDADNNDNINQSANSKINYIKRAIRRLKSYNLTSEQQQQIISELEQSPQLANCEIALKLSPSIDASEQDIVDFIRSTDYRFRHRHRRESTVLDWNILD